MKSLALAALLIAGLSVAGPVTITQVNSGTPCSASAGGGISNGEGVFNITAQYFVFGSGPITPGSCTVTVTAEFATEGPARPGFLLVTTMPGNQNGSNIVTVDGSETGCGNFVCLPPTLTIPYTFGDPFEASVAANAFAVSIGLQGFAEINVTVQAYENVVPEGSSFTFQRFSAIEFTPEPGALLLTLAGLGLVGFVRMWASRRRSAPVAIPAAS